MVLFEFDTACNARVCLTGWEFLNGYKELIPASSHKLDKSVSHLASREYMLIALSIDSGFYCTLFMLGENSFALLENRKRCRVVF
jgi:hypothetical protein